eukprot:UN06838
MGDLGDPKFVENWECIFTGSGHKSDVEEIAWSPDSKSVASAGLDITIIIWHQKTPGNFERHRILRGHTNWVKGLAWDPLNKFLASQGAEGCMMLWRTSDWESEAKLDKQFLDRTDVVFHEDADSNTQVVFSRPSWSPDGLYLVGSFGVKIVSMSRRSSREAHGNKMLCSLVIINLPP